MMFKFLKVLEEVSCRLILRLGALGPSSMFLECEAALASTSVFWLTLSTSGAEENESDRS